MTSIGKMMFALVLAMGLASPAQARPPAPWGGGWYGEAWYNNGQGSVIAGAATYEQCVTELHLAIEYARRAGEIVVRYIACHYREPNQFTPVPEDPDYAEG